MDKKNYAAHLRKSASDVIEEQSVWEHNVNVSEGAGRLLAEIGLSACGRLAGLLHDMGKATATFDRYIRAGFAGEKVVRGSVNHTFAAVRYLMDHFHHDWDDGINRLTCELLACAVGSHHGLFDCVRDQPTRSALLYRQTREGTGYEEALIEFHRHTTDEEVSALFAAARAEIEAIYTDRIQGMSSQSEEREDEACLNYVGMLMRLICSAVIEADRNDTMTFCAGKMEEGPADGREIWLQIRMSLNKYLGAFPQETEIQQARKCISEQCARFSTQDSGVYRLNVPTGGGKTLSAFRFAVEHALAKNKTRIFYVAPMISILEQNAEELRKTLPDKRWLVEHHSNVIREDGFDDSDELFSEMELLTENWHAPIIVTTMVQLLNTLFDGKTSCIRRFQALCSSVLIIDEVQAVPTGLLSLFNLAMNFLSEVCGATVLLCSATQPCFEQTAFPMLIQPETPVPYSHMLWKPFKRTVLTPEKPLRQEELADFARQVLAETSSLLIVCNKTAQASRLFDLLKGPDMACYHLSSRMCIAHRREVLTEMSAALEAIQTGGRKVLCVATQVIEAGVDVSFGRVIRLSAGMDSIVQAAGRCNRNGESKEAVPVYIVPVANEDLSRLPEIQRQKDVTGELLYVFQRHPERFSGDLSSDAAIGYYYRGLFGKLAEGASEGPVERRRTLIDLLGLNEMQIDDDDDFILHQAFRTAGSLFKVFDDDTEDVIVPYDDRAKEIRDELSAWTGYSKLDRVYSLIREARPYTIALRHYQTDKLMETGALTRMCDGTVSILSERNYDKDTGFIISDTWNGLLEV